MLKNLIFTIIFSFVSLLFVTDVKADIFIENITEKNIRSSEDYDDYVRKVLYNTKFNITNKDELNSSLSVSFVKDQFTIIYRDKQTMNCFTGSFSVFNNSLNMKVDKYYKSNLYGFYDVEDLSKNPEKIDTSLSISDSEISLGFSSNTFSNLNTKIYVEQNKSIDFQDEEQLMILNSDLLKTFKTQQSWRFDVLDGKQNFDYISFYSDTTLYLINISNGQTVTLAKCKYDFSGNRLNLIPEKFYKINKVDSSMQVYDFASKNKTIAPNEAKYLLDDKNLVLELFYFDKTNGYYLKDASNEYKKIVPTTIAAPNLSLKTPTSAEISKIAKGEFLISNPNLYLNFSGNNGLLITKDAEYRLDGRFTFNENRVKFDFSVINYFIKNKDGIAFIEDDDWNKYAIEFEFYYLDDKLTAVITSSSYDKIPIVANTLIYNSILKIDDYSNLSIPTKIEDVDLSLTIKNKTYSFTQIDKENSPKYTVVFNDNSRAKLIIESQNTTEILEGNYKISGNRIEINNDNKNYSKGDYSDYSLGLIKNTTPNWYITIPIFAKYDQTNNQIYFAIYDGRQYGKSTSNYSYEQTVASGAYYLAKRINDEYNVFEADKASQNNIEKNLVNGSFMVNDGTKVETYYLDKDGSAIVTTKSGRDLVKYTGKYNINGSSVYINIDKKYIYNQNSYVTEVSEKINIALSIYKNIVGDKFYLKLYDDIYLNIDNSATIAPLSIPTSIKKSDIETLLKDKKLLYTSNGEVINFTFFKDGNLKKQTMFDTLDGKYKIEDGKIDITYNNKKETIYIKTDKANLYLSFDNSKFYIYTLNSIKSAL